MENKIDFVSNVDGKEVKLVMVGITTSIRNDSNKIYTQSLFENVENGIPFTVEVEEVLRKKAIFDPEVDNQKREELSKKLRDTEIALRSAKVGSRKITKDEGRKLALKIKELRAELSNLSQNRSSLLSNTAESIAENVRLNYCVYRCTLNQGTLDNYWKSYEDFKNDIGSKVYTDAVNKFITLSMGVDLTMEKKLYENQWLIRMGFMNEDLQLIDNNGRPVDEKGRLIDKEGRFINEEGKYVDAFGNPINQDGELLIEDGWKE